MLAAIIQLIFLLVSPWIFLVLGRTIVTVLQRVARSQEFAVVEIFDSEAWYFLQPLGLLFFLSLVFFGKCLGLPWILAVFLASFGALIHWRSFLPDLLSLTKVRITANFALWITVLLPLGISLFTGNGAIRTIWANNYGDLTFHFGQITSFAWGANFPPEYPIFPGERLSYPFMINLWSAAFFWLNSSWNALSFIFLFQWLFVWIVIYKALNGDRWRLVPWAVLFGGGTYSYVFSLLGADPSATEAAKWSHEYISSGYPWAPFLSTIWITQRPTLIGMIFLIPALRLFHLFLRDSGQFDSGQGDLEQIDDQGDRDSQIVFDYRLAVAGLLCGIGIICHTHFAVVGICYIGLVLLFRLLGRLKGFSLREGIKQAKNIETPKSYFNLVFFCGGLLPGFFFTPWVLGKAGIVQWAWGWMPWPRWEAIGPLNSLTNSSLMWIQNAPAWFFVLLLLAILRGVSTSVVVLVVLFLLGNLTQFAIWEWDQGKFFIGLYLITLSLLVSGCRNGSRVSRGAEQGELAVLWNLALLLLIIPGLFECVRVWHNFKEFEVYTEEAVKQAADIRAVTEPKAVILAAPRHNSLLTLTGRRLFSGYEGTLNSHGINYRQRKASLDDIPKLIRCVDNPVAAIPCPQYLLWSGFEIERWGKDLPAGEAELTPMLGEVFYKINSSAAQPPANSQ